MAAALGRHAPVAVGAADLASGDLSIDGGEAAAVPREARDGVALETYVIELEDQWILLPAVGARSSSQNPIYVNEVALDDSRRVRAGPQL